MMTVRPAAVAGTFYPGNPDELAEEVARYMSEVPDRTDLNQDPPPKIIIAPHAGHIYSGPTAAAAYARIRPAHAQIKRVVIMGPCHRVPVRGIAASGAESFRTPLGDIPVDTGAIEQIAQLPWVGISDEAHAEDHCIEVHLPFLQIVLDDFSIVPLIVGMANIEDVAQTIEILWGGPETLILISSDLTHYLPYDDAKRRDDETRRAIEAMAIDDIADDQACGRFAVKGAMRVALDRGLRAKTLDLRNSGDTAGPKDRVVGYGSWMFVPDGGAKSQKTDPASRDAATETSGPDSSFGAETKQLLHDHGPRLLDASARSIRHGLQKGKPPDVAHGTFPGPLQEDGASFVTLTLDGKLRGCIGSLRAHQPLISDVVDNGFKAAFRDPRFEPLNLDELQSGLLALSISVLSRAVEMTFTDQDDLLAQLRPGIDGLIIRDDSRQAVFLPSVWEALPEGSQFIGHLKRKAGLAEDHWSDRFKAWRFVTETMSSKDLADPGAIWHSAG